MRDTSEHPDRLDFCRSHWPELVEALEHSLVDPEYKREVITVLQQCQIANHAGFHMVMTELHGCRSHPVALGSLLNEVRQYADEQYRNEVNKHVTEECDESNLTYGKVLAQWLEDYQMWCRGIT